MRAWPEVKCGVILLAAAVITACSQGQVSNPQEKYFNAQDFYNTETARLKNTGYTLEKTINTGTTREMHEIKKPDWNLELEIFKTADLDKSAYYGYYDTAHRGDTLIYTLHKNSDLPIKLVEVVKEAGAVKYLRYHKYVKNYLYESEEHANYIKDKAIHIEKREKVRFLNANEYKIESRFFSLGDVK